MSSVKITEKETKMSVSSIEKHFSIHSGQHNTVNMANNCDSDKSKVDMDRDTQNPTRCWDRLKVHQTHMKV